MSNISHLPQIPITKPAQSGIVRAALETIAALLVGGFISHILHIIS